MAARTITLSVAQIQSMALKTLGFRDDVEVTVRAPYDDSTEVEFDIYHCRVGIDHDGKWRVYSRDKNGDADFLINQGDKPNFIENRRLW